MLRLGAIGVLKSSARRANVVNVELLPAIARTRISVNAVHTGHIRNGVHSVGRLMAPRRLFSSEAMSQELSKIQLVGHVSPDKGLKMIEEGWSRGRLPMSQAVADLYVSYVHASGKSDTLNVGKLQAAIAAANGGSVPAASAVASLESMDGYRGGFVGVAGSTPSNPIYANVIKAPLSVAEAMKASFLKFFQFSFGLAIAYFVMDSLGLLPGSNKSGSSGSSVFGGKLGLGRGPVRQAEISDKRFTDVVGVDEAKADLQEIVQYLKDPSRFTRLGATLPRGVLLLGPPGTGKTLLAKAIAGEAGVPFFYAAGSEFEEMFVGVGASRVRELFQAAKAKAPCIIFLDEIDAMGGSRQLKDQSAMKMTLNQLLTEMDGFETNPGVIVIGATNFAEALDKALTRPGRFDKHVEVPAPDVGGRLQILELYGSKVPCDDDVDFDQLARGTPGFTGADLYNLVNQAALKAAGDNLQCIGMAAFEWAKDKILMGAERKTAVISPESMKCTAFHEAGHALVALKTDGADPIHKATIMPRGRALGMVMQLPDGDQVSMSKKQMLARLDVCMGGRVAEELVFGPDNVTSGASSDIQQATRLARAMVMKFGLSEKMGFMYIDEKESPVADNTTVAIDAEVRQILEESYARAKKVLTNNRHELDNIANGLLNFESLSGKEVADLAKGIQPIHSKRSMKPSRELKQVPMPANTNSGSKQSDSAKPVPVPVPAPVSSVSVNSNETTSIANNSNSKVGKWLSPFSWFGGSSRVPPGAAAAAAAVTEDTLAPPKPSASVAAPSTPSPSPTPTPVVAKPAAAVEVKQSQPQQPQQQQQQQQQVPPVSSPVNNGNGAANGSTTGSSVTRGPPKM